MAEQIISPGVFTRENDLSFLPQGVQQIGAAIIGPTVKGPAFVPTVVRSFQEFENRFGPLSKDTFVPQTVQEYLKNAGSVTVCRVLAGGGYTFTDGTNEVIGLAVSSSLRGEAVLLGLIYPSKDTDSKPTLQTSTLIKSGSGHIDENFSLTLAGSNITDTQISASVNPANDNYLFKQIGDSPNNSKTGVVTYDGGGTTGGYPGYTYKNFKNFQTDLIAAATKEVATITLGTSATSTISTSSLQDHNLLNSGSIYIKAVDGTFHTLAFDTSTVVGGGAATNIAEGLSGSLTEISLTSAGIDGGITSSELAQATMIAVNTISGLTASRSDNVVTITQDEVGGVVDISTTFSSTPNTASVATSTQGVDVTGYGGYNLDRDLIFITQSASTIEYKGGPGLTTTTEGYGYASSPFITSQFLNANKTTQDLFRFHTLDHGKEVSMGYKISIANLREPSDIDGVEQYSTFSVLVRAFGDTDQNPVILEQFNNCNLDPDSPRYLARVFGDRFPEYNETLDKVELKGDYPNQSVFCRVEINEQVAEKSTSPKLSPKGFRAVKNCVPGTAFTPNVIVPSASYEGIQTTEDGSTNPVNYSTKGFLGFKFREKDSDNENFFGPIPSVPTEQDNIAGDFNVENHFGHPSSSLWTGSLSKSLDTTGANGPTNAQLKFTVPFQGGDDGIAPHTVIFTGAESTLASEYENGTNVFGFDVSSTTAAGFTGYKKALDILSNQDQYDINMLVIPGIVKSIAPSITNAGINMVEDRGDAFYVMDLCQATSTVNSAVGHADGLDTNYAAVYYPWVKVLDTSRNKPVLVPPSVIVPGAIAQSDNIGAEWFAPAGLNRGVLGNVIEAKITLNQAERDKLYEAKINPIATFPATGVCIWGQKTLQERSTALNRINVRRLLITLKKFIASSSRFLVFEQNTLATRNRFLNIVNPYLESVQQRQGLFAFRVQMDEANNTPEVIDRNQLVGAIFLQPTKTAEFIVLDFNVLPTGATFDTGGGAGGGGATGGGGGGGY